MELECSKCMSEWIGMMKSIRWEQIGQMVCGQSRGQPQQQQAALAGIKINEVFQHLTKRFRDETGQEDGGESERLVGLLVGNMVLAFPQCNGKQYGRRFQTNPVSTFCFLSQPVTTPNSIFRCVNQSKGFLTVNIFVKDNWLPDKSVRQPPIGQQTRPRLLGITTDTWKPSRFHVYRFIFQSLCDWLHSVQYVRFFLKWFIGLIQVL